MPTAREPSVWPSSTAVSPPASGRQHTERARVLPPTADLGTGRGTDERVRVQVRVRVRVRVRVGARPEQ